MTNWKSALSKFGGVLASLSTLIPVVGPLVGGFIKTVIPAGGGATADKVVQEAADFSVAASQIITNVEAFGQALSIKGPDKLKAVVGPMTSALYASQAFYGTKIQDQSLFSEGAQDIANGFAKCWNAVHPDSVQTVESVKG